MNRQGSALLTVLWMTVILSFVGMSLASTVRSEVESTRISAESEQGYFLARAGLDAALLRMMAPPNDPVQAEREMYFREYNFAFDTGSALVQYRPASALYNVNLASVPMLAALFVELGRRPDAAATLAREIGKYRKPPAPLPPRFINSIEDLLAVPGMTRELFYGGFSGGKRHPPLYEVLGVYATGEEVNVNYAHFELLSVLPGMDEARAAQLLAMRPIFKLDPGPRNRSLTVADAASFTLIAHGRGRGSDVERVVRAVYVKDQKHALGVRLVEWHDTD